MTQQTVAIKFWHPDWGGPTWPGLVYSDHIMYSNLQAFRLMEKEDLLCVGCHSSFLYGQHVYGFAVDDTFKGYIHSFWKCIVDTGENLSGLEPSDIPPLWKGKEDVERMLMGGGIGGSDASKFSIQMVEAGFSPAHLIKVWGGTWVAFAHGHIRAPIDPPGLKG